MREIEYYKKIMDCHAKVQETIENKGWSQYEKEGNFAGYTMKGEEGFLCIKSTGIIPCTPIEVQHP